MHMQTQQMPPVEPSRLLQVTLPAEQWHIVLRAVDELPHRLARPVIDALTEQFRQQSQQQPGMSSVEEMNDAIA